ncbi:MAG: hypothetical protein E7354_00760 [Clostridiales bacterium]|nr:hypothetical protein [Clostridiales bacterium]
MTKFSDYMDREDGQSRQEESKTAKKTSVKSYEEMIAKYSKLSNSELMQEFMRLTMKEKEKGSLKDEELEGIKNRLAPYLEQGQKDGLDRLIQMVKNVK